jgi:aconitate hydratase
MTQTNLNSFNACSKLKVGLKTYSIFCLDSIKKAGLPDPSRLPVSLRVLLENLMRHEDGNNVRKEDIETLARWNPKEKSDREIAFTPARVILQDFTGVPAIVDLAAMRDAVQKMGGDPELINPLQPVDLVVDHSVQVDYFGSRDAFSKNTKIEFERNKERYEFLRWGQKVFRDFRVVPPGAGIVHQVNLEYLAHVVFSKKDGNELLAYPDTLVGTDSHTTMINGLGVLGWGVGGIEAEAAMLGQPISMLIPEVVGFKLTGFLKEGTTATDLVLTVTQMLRKKGVVGKFVEFYGKGLSSLSLPDRATLANMAPEYGATMGFFPIDGETLSYLKLSGRSEETIQLVEAYSKEQGLFRTDASQDPEFSDTLALDLAAVEPSIAGPKRPQDRVLLKDAKASFESELPNLMKSKGGVRPQNNGIDHGSIVIAAITSCTNTSNPAVMLGAGLLAKKAVERGLNVKPWVKTSLAPGSKVVMDYLEKADLLKPLEALKFHLVGYGCTTCIGNSGPLSETVGAQIKEGDLVAVAVLSGNRNFEGRINPLVRANYLASPPLVVAYAIAGSMNVDLVKDPIGIDASGKPVYLRDIWPTRKEVEEALSFVTTKLFRDEYENVFKGDLDWQSIAAGSEKTFQWNQKSTYVKSQPVIDSMPREPKRLEDIVDARVLVLCGDSVTTDHISPAGAIAVASPAGTYLVDHGVDAKDFNSYGSRRGNFEVMMRGTFANIRFKNQLAKGKEGGFTRHFPSGTEMSIFDAATRYRDEKVPLIVIAGKEYGTGSSRDWAAKGPCLLGVKVVIAESFERIHRSNLIGMGILPLQFEPGTSAASLKLTGEETFDLKGVHHVRKEIEVAAKTPTQEKRFKAVVRIDTPAEHNYYQNGGILQFVLRSILKDTKKPTS